MKDGLPTKCCASDKKLTPRSVCGVRRFERTCKTPKTKQKHKTNGGFRSNVFEWTSVLTTRLSSGCCLFFLGTTTTKIETGHSRNMPVWYDNAAFISSVGTRELQGGLFSNPLVFATATPLLRFEHLHGCSSPWLFAKGYIFGDCTKKRVLPCHLYVKLQKARGHNRNDRPVQF